ELLSERGLGGRRRLAVARADPHEQFVGRALERGATDLADMRREVLLDHPAQKAAIRSRGELVERDTQVLAEPEHDDLAVPAQVARRPDPARATRIAHAGDLSPVAALELELAEHAD